MAAPTRRSRRSIDIWPGFVDALATLLIIIIFVLMVFVLAQFFLGQALTGRTAELGRLGRQLNDLTEQLSLERRTGDRLRLDTERLTAELAAATAQLAGMPELEAERETLARRVGELTNYADTVSADLIEAHRVIDASKETVAAQLRDLALLRNDVAALTALKAELEEKTKALGARLGENEGQIAKERELSKEARAQAALLNQQLDTVRKELERLNAALAAAEALGGAQKIEIANLGQRLNQALASRVEELSRYRSEFFGRLREVLGNRPGIRVEGDRFVFQSEVLFETGSAKLGEDGQRQLDGLAGSVRELMQKIPANLKWVLRVDGHTDKVRIANDRFASNWELSAARALSVVRYLMDHGVPPERLAAAGFGEFQPLDPGTDEPALRRNRRIELKLDQR